jgi:carboxypeptidase Q
MRRAHFGPALAVALVAVVAAEGPQTSDVDTAVNVRIRAEGLNNSHIMKTMHVLTDVYGPRLSGSPNHENAARWAVRQMEEWGLRNGRLEPFDFAREGWLNEKASGHIVSPVKDNLVFEVLGWTPSTKGTVVGPAVQVVAPQGPLVENAGGRGGQQRLGPTADELKQYLSMIAPRLKGAIVLVGAQTVVPFQETAPAKRLADDAARGRYNPPPAGPEQAGRGGRGGRGDGGRAAGPPAEPVRLSSAQVATSINEFLLTSGALVRVNDAGREHGQIRAFAGTSYDVTKHLPTVVLRNEDYGRITRLLADGTPVALEFTIENRTYAAGRMSYNAIAEIPGTDKAAEVVMLGGHLDSWHSATGATDNAIGCAVMMEAARILQAIGVRPRRTIRVALWGGEEQGLLGSVAYVRDHFGTFEQPKPEYATFGGYFNVDSGTGRIRGASIFGPPEAAAVIAPYLKAFEDFGVYGAVSTSARQTGGTDSTSFNAAGLPGINLGQDPIEYNSHTWHSNLDTLERIVEDDVRKSAVAIASVIYHVAMRDEMLPRFAAGSMPAPPPTGRGGAN